MLSHKWTFSLQILVVLLALASVGPSAMAGEFGVSLSIADARDVSYEDGYQIQRRIDGQSDLLRTTILVKTDKVVNALPNDAADDILSTGLHYKHFTAIAYNKFGGATIIENTQGTGTESGAQGTIPLIGSPPDGKNFQFDFALPPNSAADIVRIHIFLDKHKFEVADPRAYLNTDGTRKVDGKNAAASIDFHYVRANGLRSPAPVIYQIRRSGNALLPVTEATFDVLVTLSEEPKKDTFTKDRFDISNAKITAITALGAFDEVDEGTANTLDAGDMFSTGRGRVSDWKIYKYLLTVTPNYENKNDIVIKIKEWESQEKPGPEKYSPPATDTQRTEGKDMLTVKVGKEVLKDTPSGLVVNLTNKRVIPKDGYLIVATDPTMTGIDVPTNADADDNSPKATERTPAELLYNVIKVTLPNLETFLGNGGTIDVVGPEKVVISEIMWGSDASLATNSHSQWIELKNKSGKELKTGEDNYQLIFYGPNETPPAKVAVAAVAATGTLKAQPAGMALPAGVTDRVGTIDEKGAYWSIAGKGMSGRSGTGEKQAELVAVVPTQAIISMYRVADADGRSDGVKLDAVDTAGYQL